MSPKEKDAITLLTEDHREVSGLFEQYEQLTDRARVTKKKLADQICTALKIHTQIEEELFYPAVHDAAKAMEDLVDEALVEHASAKELIAQLEDMDPGDDLYDAKVKVLSEQIEHHVEEEEQELFPKVKKLKLDLTELGSEMAARKDELTADPDLIGAAPRGPGRPGPSINHPRRM